MTDSLPYATTWYEQQRAISNNWSLESKENNWSQTEKRQLAAKGEGRQIFTKHRRRWYSPKKCSPCVSTKYIQTIWNICLRLTFCCQKLRYKLLVSVIISYERQIFNWVCRLLSLPNPAASIDSADFLPNCVLVWLMVLDGSQKSKNRARYQIFCHNFVIFHF